MAQRSARARSKLDKITAANGGPTSPQHNRRPTFGGHGGARLGSGGLLTPCASSVSGSSTRNSLQLQQPQRIGKGTFRNFIDAQGEKLRRGLAHGNQRKDANDGARNFYSGLGGGIGGIGHGSGGFGGLSNLGTIDERVLIKRWEGSGSRGEVWDGGGKGKKDLELWFPDGDTLVYLSENPMPSRNPQGLYKPPVPQPSFRLRSSVLRNTESPYLISLLEESFRERSVTPAPQQDDEIFSAQQMEEQSMDYEYQLRRTRTLESAASVHSQGTVGTQDTTESGILHRIYFPAPSRLDKIGRHCYHLTTRNFFAMLFNRSLVGITLGQTLLDLVERTNKYLSSPTPMEYDMADRGLSEIESPYGSFLSAGSMPHSTQPQQPSHPNTQRMIINYLQAREFGDVRNWAEGAAGLLVWSERAEKQTDLSAHDRQRLESLWREGFVHCTGLLSVLQMQPEWRDISPITKALIDRASLEIQVRVSTADARMSGFNFHDMWPVSSAGSPPARLAFDRFQKFLMKHYASRFGSWPPGEGKFTRTLYLHLQRDFATLYSYLVDQDAVWSPAHDQPSPSRRTIAKPAIPNWRADDEALPMTEILLTFDERESHPPIPHPFPLVPPTNTLAAGTPSNPNKKQKGFFPSANQRNRASNANPGAALAALALSESTNIEALKSSTTSNPLLEAFQTHEKSTPAHEVSPHDARKGRWIMIYGVLQTLASVAVDAPGVQWHDGVEYWINPKLRGTPPWKTTVIASPQDEGDERSHFRSHCWVSNGSAMATPTATIPAAFSQRMRTRSRSRSRKQLRALHREHVAARAAELGAKGQAENSSGDEGDDEMDAGETPPPSQGQGQGQCLRTWGQRHVRSGGESPGVVKNDEAPWEME